jgi:hypothetical protein
MKNDSGHLNKNIKLDIKNFRSVIAKYKNKSTELTIEDKILKTFNVIPKKSEKLNFIFTENK